MELYTAAGQRWTYTCQYCLQSSLLYRYCAHYRCESAWESAGDWIPALEPAWKPACESRVWESRASGGVEFSTGSFWPMANSEFVEALANGQL